MRNILVVLGLFISLVSNATGGHFVPFESIFQLDLRTKVKLPDTLQDSRTLQDYGNLLEGHIEAGLFKEAESFIDKTTDQFLSAISSPSKAKYAIMAADVYHYRGKYTLAEQYFERSRKLYDELNDPDGVIEANIGISETLKFVEDFEGSIKSGYQALAIADSLGRPDKVADIKSILGRIFIDRGDSKAAKPLIDDAREYFEEENDPVAIAMIHEDLAFLYAEYGDLDTAFEYAEMAYKSFKELNDADGFITSSYLLSSLYIREQNWNQALAFIDQAIIAIEAVEDKRELHNYYMDKSFILMQIGRTDMARAALEMFRTYGHRFEDPSTEMRYFKELTDLHRLDGEYQQAVVTASRYDAAKDAFNNFKKEKAIEELKIKYKTEQRELELAEEKSKNEALRMEQKNIRLRRNLWITLLAGIALVLILIINQGRVNNKKDLAARNLQLEGYTSRIIEKNKLIEQFETQLSELEKLNEQQETSRRSKMDQLYSLKILTDKDWNQYKQLFASVHSNFLPRLTTVYPNLTEGEKRHLMLLKLDMTSSQMAEVLGVSQSSIRVSRHRIRKKLELAEDADLRSFCADLA